MEADWQKIIEEASKTKVFEKPGRIACFSCGKDLGEFKGEGTSHSVCSDCKSKIERESGISE